MILTEEGLRLTRERLLLAEGLLDSLRRQMLPHNEVLFGMMSQSWVDLVNSMQAEIDSYLVGGPGRRAAAREGVIRNVDFDARTFTLSDRPRGEAGIPCEYGPDLEDAVKEFLGCRIFAEGTLETARVTGDEKLEVEAIEPLPGEEVRTSADAEPAAVT